jgi:tyrosyl-tRNA synthetase
MYHGEKEAEKAQENFENTFSKGEFPEDAEVVVTNKEEKIIEDKKFGNGYYKESSILNGLNEIITNDKIAKPNKVMNICLSLGLFNMPNNIYAIIFIFLKLFL